MKAPRAISASEFRWPSGDYRDAGTLATTPAEIEATLGVAFEAGLDDLDYYRALVLELPSGRRVALNWYERAPEPRNVAVWADARDDLSAALRETLDVLALPWSSVAWRPQLPD